MKFSKSLIWEGVPRGLPVGRTRCRRACPTVFFWRVNHRTHQSFFCEQQRNEDRVTAGKWTEKKRIEVGNLSAYENTSDTLNMLVFNRTCRRYGGTAHRLRN